MPKARSLQAPSLLPVPWWNEHLDRRFSVRAQARRVQAGRGGPTRRPSRGLDRGFGTAAIFTSYPFATAAPFGSAGRQRRVANTGAFLWRAGASELVAR